MSTYDRARHLQEGAAEATHPSGYIRETAVRRLWRHGGPAALPVLIVRLNDWVPAVRAVAREATIAVLGGDPAEVARVLVDNIALVDRLAHGQRAEHGPVLDVMAEILTDRAPEALVLAALDPGNPARRAALRFALARGGRAGALVRAQGMYDDDPRVRLLAVHALIRDDGLELLERHATELLADPFPAVRLVVIRNVEDPPMMYGALFDESAAVRAEARAGLALPDYSATYREVVQRDGDPRLVAAIGGLAETGTPADVPTILRHLGSPWVAVRRAVVRALARLDAPGHQAIFLSVLDDGSVGREAAAALAERMHVVSEEEVSPYLAPGRPVATRKRALDLLARLDRWTALAVLLEAASLPEPALAFRARTHLERWTGKADTGFVPPRPGALDRIDAALAKAGPHLGGKLRHWIDWAMAPWRKR